MKKVKVDKSACICCGACVGTAPDIFAYDDDGTSKVIKPEVQDDDKGAIISMEGCPTGAISLEDANKACTCKDCECEHCDCEKE